jgi:hypothetical protein
MQPNEIIEVLNRPISQELLARDVTRLAYVAKDGTPRNVPIAFTGTGRTSSCVRRRTRPNSRGHPRAQAPETTAPVGETHLSVWRTAKIRFDPPRGPVGQLAAQVVRDPFASHCRLGGKPQIDRERTPIVRSQ